jgi:predicted metal-dependent HD superfamily phosphohydrolase
MNEEYFRIGQYDPNFLRARWDELCSRRRPDPPEIETLFETLAGRYSEEGRAYHTLSHIQSLLLLSDSLREKFLDYEAVCFAIWFHDVIYDTKRSDNEEKSADLATASLPRLGVPAQTVSAAREMILATKHHRGVDLNWDAMAFLDLDTSILGAPERVYREYSLAIRKEYSWVLNFLYKRGRKKVLRDFLERDRIYFTDEIGSKYEAQARSNIAQELRDLAGGAVPGA